MVYTMNFPFEDLDRMTALPSKKAWLAFLEKQSETSLLMIDLDNLKRFQDVRGLHSGDKAIRMVADILAERWTQSVVPCRWGGEEFGVAVLGLDRAGISALAEQIRSVVEKKFFPDYHTGELVNMTVSVGVGYRKTGSQCPLQHLLEHADRALCESKDKGRNRTIIKEVD